jgi:hypothetical protein
MPVKNTQWVVVTPDLSVYGPWDTQWKAQHWAEQNHHRFNVVPIQPPYTVINGKRHTPKPNVNTALRDALRKHNPQ